MSDRDVFVRIVVIVVSVWFASAAIDEVVTQTFVRVSSALDSWAVANDDGEGNAVFAMADSDSLCDAVLAGMGISTVCSPTCDVTKVTADLKAYYKLNLMDSFLFLAAQNSIAQQLHPTAKLFPPAQNLPAYVTLSVPPVEFTQMFAMVQSYNASGLLSRETSIMQIAVTVMVRIITSNTTFVPSINQDIVKSTLQKVNVRQGHPGHRCMRATVNFLAGDWNQCLDGCLATQCKFFNIEPIVGTSNWSCAGGFDQVVLDQNQSPESVACFANNILLLADTTILLIPSIQLRLRDVGWRTALSISNGGNTGNWTFAGPSNFDDCYSLGTSPDARQNSYCLVFNRLHVRLLMQRLSDGFKYSFDVGAGGPASLRNLLSHGSSEARTFVGAALWTQGLNDSHSPCAIEEGFLIQRQMAVCRFGAILGAIYENYTADAPLQAIAETQARANAETCDFINSSYKYDGPPCDGIGTLPNCSTKLSAVCPSVNSFAGNSTGDEVCPERCALDTSYKATCHAVVNHTFVVGVGCAAFGPGNASETVGIWRYKAGVRTFEPSNATLLVAGSVEDQVSVLNITIQNDVVVDIRFARFVMGVHDISRVKRASISNRSQPSVRSYNIAVGDYITRLVVVSLTLNCTICNSSFRLACDGIVFSWSPICLQCSQYVVDFCAVSSGVWNVTKGIAFETSSGLYMSYNSDATTYVVTGAGGIQHTFYTTGPSSHISGVRVQEQPGVISGAILGIVESPLAATSNFLDTPQLQKLSLASMSICGTQPSRERNCFINSSWCNLLVTHFNVSGVKDPTTPSAECMMRSDFARNAWRGCLMQCSYVVPAAQLMLSFNNYYDRVYSEVKSFHCSACNTTFAANTSCRDLNPACRTYCISSNNTSQNWPWAHCSEQVPPNATWCDSATGRKSCFGVSKFCTAGDLIRSGSGFSLAQTSECFGNLSAMGAAWLECLKACLPFAGVDNTTLEKERNTQLAMVEGILGQAHCQLCVDTFTSCAVAANPTCPMYCNNLVNYTLRDANGTSLQYPPNPWPWATCPGQASASGFCTSLAGRKSCFRNMDFCPWFDSIQNGSDFSLAQTSACLDNSSAMSEAWRGCLIACLPFAGVDSATLEQEGNTQFAIVEAIMAQAHCQLCIDLFTSCAVAANPSCPKYCDNSANHTLRDANGAILQYPPNPWPWATCRGQASASGFCTSLHGRKSCFRTMDFCPWFDSIQNGSDFSLAQTSACLDNSNAMSEAWRGCLVACLPFAGVDNATLELEGNTQFAIVEGIMAQAHCQLCVDLFPSCALAANPSCPKYCNNVFNYTLRDADGASLQYPPNPWPWATCPGQASASGYCTSLEGRRSCFRTMDFCPWFDSIQNGSDFSLAQTSACLNNSSAMREAWRECLIACLPFAGVDSATLEQERVSQLAIVEGIISRAHCQLCINMFPGCSPAPDPSCRMHCNSLVTDSLMDARGTTDQYLPKPWPWTSCDAHSDISCMSADGRKACFRTLHFCAAFDLLKNGSNVSLAQTSACLNNLSVMSETWLDCLVTCRLVAGIDNGTIEQERNTQVVVVKGIIAPAHCQLCITTFSGCGGALDSSCPQFCNGIVNYSLVKSNSPTDQFPPIRWPWSNCSSQVPPNLTWCTSAIGRTSCFRVSNFCLDWDPIKNASGFTLVQTSACLDNMVAIGMTWLDCLVGCLAVPGVDIGTLLLERNYEFDVVKGILSKMHCQLCVNAFSGCSAVLDPRCMKYCNDSVNHSFVDTDGITRQDTPTRWPWLNCSGQVSATTSTSTTMPLTLSRAQGVSLTVRLKCATAAASSCNVSKSDFLVLVAEIFGQPESDIDVKVVYRVSVKYSLKVVGVATMDSEKVRKVLRTVYPDIEANEPLGIVLGDLRRLQTAVTSVDTSVDINMSTLHRDLFDQLRLQPLDPMTNPVSIAFMSLTNVSAALAEVPLTFVDFVAQVLPRGNSTASDSYISFWADPAAMSSEILDQLRLRYPELQSVDAALVDIGSFWTVDNWSNCTSKCGSGSQWRRVFCGAKNDDGIEIVSPVVECLRDFPSPEETRTCYATCSWFESYASMSNEVKASIGVAILAVVSSILGCCCFAVAFCLWRKCKQPRRGVVRSNKNVTGVESVEWELVTRPLEKAHIVWKLDEETIAMFQVNATVLNTDEPTLDDRGQNHTTIVVETSCQDALVYPQLFPAYQSGDVVEYFSISNQMWTGGEILIDLNSQRGEVVYNVVICQGRQIRANVPLYLVRKPMQPGEPCSYFSVQRGRWDDGFISCCEQAARPLLSGYRVDISDSSMCGPGSKCYPAARIRRRYPLGTPVEVYIDAAKGWQPAIILECNEDVSEQPHWATSRVNLRAIHEDLRLPSDNEGKALRIWLKARVELKENGDILERWTWLVRSVGDGWW